MLDKNILGQGISPKINQLWATTLIIIVFIILMVSIILAPVRVEAHCKTDISYVSNEQNCWLGTNTTNCPLPTNIQCKINTEIPFISAIFFG